MNTSRLLKSLVSNNRFLLQLVQTPKFRTFLSESYQCREAWNKRLETPLLKKVKPVDFYLELDQKFQMQNKISAIDVDIFANKIQDSNQYEELIDILHKLRTTRDTSFTLESTHHAVIRYFLDIGETEQLLTLLDDRLNYGIFSDYFCYNLLMDHFIKKQTFGAAAQVASFMMLQEEFEHPISNALAIYSCHKYLENSDTWQAIDPASLKEEPKEEIKICVKYIRNPYFDDHFDLFKPSDLVGKTLWWIGETINSPLGRSCQLRGLILYKKYHQAISLIEEWKQKKTKEVVYKDILLLIKKDVPEIFTEQATEEEKKLQESLQDLEKADLFKDNFDQDIESLVKKAVEAHSTSDIENQKKIYEKWEETRIKVLQQQLAELDKQARLLKLENIKKDLIEREHILTFFENEEKIELKIQEKLEKEKKMFDDEKIVTQDVEEDYIPPEIVKKRVN